MRGAFLLISALIVGCSAEPIHAERVPHRVTADPVAHDDSARAKTAAKPAMAVIQPHKPLVSKMAMATNENDCRPGARKACFEPGALPRGTRSPMMNCYDDGEGHGFWGRDDCGTPIVVAFDDAPVRFTHATGNFAIGPSPNTEWVGAETPWLALDRDGSGCIDSEHELFAGFAKLALLDVNGDGRLDRHDPAFGELVLWADLDQDKKCTPNELRPLGLASLDIVSTKMPWTGFSVEGEIAPLPGGKGRLSDVYLAPFTASP